MSKSIPSAWLILLFLTGAVCIPPAAAQEPPEPEPSLPTGHPPVSSPPAGSMPSGHPPMPSAGSLVPPVPEGSGTGTAALTWQTPAEWVEVPPASSMRRAQYRIPGPGGDAECVVYYFGPGQGGDAQDNAERWAGQFRQTDGSSSVEAMTTDTLEVGGVPVFRVEVRGDYDGGMAVGRAPQPIADAMLLGAIAQGADANWFFKLTGPRTTVEAAEEAFDSLIQSLAPGS